MRHTVSNPYHIWAHQSYADPKSRDTWRKGGPDNYAKGHGAKSFSGWSAFSYSTEIARIVERNGQRAFQVTTRKYSVTTAKHMRDLRRAIPPGSLVFHVNDTSGEGCATEEYAERITTLLDQAKRARANREWRLAEADDLAKEARAYCEFWGLDPKPFESEELANLAEVIEKARKERNEEAARQAAERLVRAQETIARWQAGEAVSVPYGLGTDFLRLGSDGETVQTSRGADAPVSHVLPVLRIVTALYREGKTWQNDGSQTHRLGHYVMEAVDADGTVWVGCHNFRKEEVERFARTVAEVLR